MNTLSVILNMGFFPVCGIVIALLMTAAGCFYGIYKLSYELQRYDSENKINMASFSLGIFIFLFIGIVIPTSIIVSILVYCLK